MSDASNATKDTHDFEQWMEAVNKCVQKRCGMSADDLPDYAYRDEWEAGARATDVADAVLEEAGFGEDDD